NACACRNEIILIKSKSDRNMKILSLNEWLEAEVIKMKHPFLKLF
ncbi:hypothetical protein HPHPP3B_1155, partial [Helicobacter pylori Hp P-3b]